MGFSNLKFDNQYLDTITVNPILPIRVIYHRSSKMMRNSGRFLFFKLSAIQSNVINLKSVYIFKCSTAFCPGLQCTFPVNNYWRKVTLVLTPKVGQVFFNATYYWSHFPLTQLARIDFNTMFSRIPIELLIFVC